MLALDFARIAAGVAALFGGALVLKEAKQTVDVVPKTVDKLTSFVLPITIIAVAYLVKSFRK